MALVIKGSTSGQVTIDVLAEAGTRAINLPAVSGNILTDGAALPAIDGSSLTGIATPITKSEVIYHSTSTVSSGNSQVTLFQDFKYPSNGNISGTFNKQSASTTMVVYFHYCARSTSGNSHTFAMWCDAGNTTDLFRATHFDPYHMSQSQVNATWCARWTGLSAGNHTFNAAMGRGDSSSVQYVVNFNENSYDGLGINTNGYSMIYAMEIE